MGHGPLPGAVATGVDWDPDPDARGCATDAEDDRCCPVDIRHMSVYPEEDESLYPITRPGPAEQAIFYWIPSRLVSGDIFLPHLISKIVC